MPAGENASILEWQSGDGENGSVDRMPVGENARVENVMFLTCPELFWANR